MCDPKVCRLSIFSNRFKWILTRNSICSIQMSIKNFSAMIYIRSLSMWILKGLIGLRPKFAMPRLWQAKVRGKNFAMDLASQI